MFVFDNLKIAVFVLIVLAVGYLANIFDLIPSLLIPDVDRSNSSREQLGMRVISLHGCNIYCINTCIHVLLSANVNIGL